MGDDVNVPSKLQSISVASIRANKTALREVDRKGEGYQNLLASVRKEGVLSPILVRESIDPDTKTVFYGLIDGLHRLTAARDAGLGYIDSKVVQATDDEVLAKQMIMNLQRVETAPSEYSKQLHRMMQANPTMTVADLAEKISRSTTYVSDRMGLLKLDEKIAGLVDAGKINVSNAFVLAKLPVEEQVNFVDRACTMTPTEFAPSVANRLREIRLAQRQGKDTAPEEFKPVAHARSKALLVAEMETPSVSKTLCSGLTSAEEGFAMAIKWALHLDAISVAEAKAKDDARKAEVEAAKKRKEEEKAAKKAKEAAETQVVVQNA
jgi:ParB/RepB/Spo0J family partition protein